MSTRLPPGLQLDDVIASLGSIPGAAILESLPGFRESGELTILAPPPLLIFEATDENWRITYADGAVLECGQAAPLERLAAWIAELGLCTDTIEKLPGVPPFQGGLIGYFGYDAGLRIENLSRRHPRDSGLPDIRFGLHDLCATYEHRSETLRLWQLPIDGSKARQDRSWKAFRDVLLRPSVERPKRSALSEPRSGVSRESYESAVRRALEYIAAGDIFQVNLSQRFSSTGDVDPLDLYLRLRRRSRAPYSAFLRWGDSAIVSASPELFFQTRGDHIVTKPIKGTRARVGQGQEDAAIIAELEASPKDRAELTMIVDLERNDLGRVCRYGTVRVVEPRKVESFPQVHHLVATIEGRLRTNVGPIDVVRAVFPGGSITGAPKIRAMEIIDELESNRRSVYTGAIGYYGRDASAFNIAIRTILVEGNRVTYQVGGGIVADSIPAAEYEETLHKGRAMLEVIRGEGSQ